MEGGGSEREAYIMKGRVYRDTERGREDKNKGR
jgi:hypothetical protein